MKLYGTGVTFISARKIFDMNRNIHVVMLFSKKNLASVKTIKVNTNIPWEKTLTAGQIVWIQKTELAVVTNIQIVSGN